MSSDSSLRRCSGQAPREEAGAQNDRFFNSTDKKIDALVYELYGLTQKEIEIVEKSEK
jgi:hypothetical protein